MNFRDLEYFLTLADVGHMGRAAAVYGMSQPALSKALKRLEDDIGIQLYDRSSGRLVMTSAGSAFLDHAKRLSASYHDTMSHASALQTGAAGILRVGATGATLERIVTPALQWLTPRRPALQIRLTVKLSDDLFNHVQEGRLDCAVAPLYGEQLEELDHDVLFEDHMCIVARKHHPLGERRRVKLADALAYSWIYPNTDSSAYRVMLGYLTRHGLPLPQVAMEVAFITPGILRIVAATELISFAPISLLKQIDASGLMVLPVASPLLRKLCLITRQGASWTPLMEAFRDAIPTVA